MLRRDFATAAALTRWLALRDHGDPGTSPLETKLLVEHIATCGGAARTVLNTQFAAHLLRRHTRCTIPRSPTPWSSTLTWPVPAIATSACRTCWPNQCRIGVWRTTEMTPARRRAVANALHIFALPPRDLPAPHWPSLAAATWLGQTPPLWAIDQPPCDEHGG